MLAENEFKVVNNFKLLSVTIDDILNFELHVELLKKKVNQKVFALKNNLFSALNYISLKLLIFHISIIVLYYFFIKNIKKIA